VLKLQIIPIFHHHTCIIEDRMHLSRSTDSVSLGNWIELPVYEVIDCYLKLFENLMSGGLSSVKSCW